MTDANAKLRRLREWLRLQRVRGLWPFVTADDAIAECDRMLAEPEPAKPEPLAMACKAPSGCCVAVASTDGSWCPQGCFPGTGRYSWQRETVIFLTLAT